MDAESLAVVGDGRWAERFLGLRTFTLFWCDSGLWFQIVSGAEVPIASTGQDGHSHVVIVPDLSPCRIELIGCFAIHDVGFFRVIERYVRNVIFFSKMIGNLNLWARIAWGWVGLIRWEASLDY